MSSFDSVGVDDEEVAGDDRKDVLLIQKLLSKATHPSPVKSMFGAEELEAAALDVSQYLASAAAAKKANLGSPVSEVLLPGEEEDEKQAEFSNDAAAAATAGATAGASNSVSRHPKPRSNSLSSDGRKDLQLQQQSQQHYSTGEAVTSRDLRASHRRRRGARLRARPPPPPSSPPPPPTATVRQLVEMGFPRATVERAVKTIDGGVGELGPSPESIVGWLLEHPDQVDVDIESCFRGETGGSGGTEGDEECSDSDDSFSDSFEDIDASGASEQAPLGVALSCIPPPEVYKRRCDFPSNDEYAYYVRERIQTGMTVRCCRTYEEVHEGDVGRYCTTLVQLLMLRFNVRTTHAQ